MNISIEVRRWKRLLRLFVENDGEGIEQLTLHLECALGQTPPCDSQPLIRTWNDMRAVVASVCETAEVAKGPSDGK